MKITFVGHASIHVETQDLSLLCDPIFTDSFCEGLNTAHPSRDVSIEALPFYDAIFISHRHLDHLDVRSLQLLRRRADVFIPDDPLMESLLKEIGFHTVTRLKEWEKLNLGATSFITTPSCNPVPELGIVIFDGTHTFWNQVDTVSTAQSIAVVKHNVGEIDYLLAPWQPFLETSLQLSGDLRFPFRLYESLLHELQLVDAHYVTPGANGLRFLGRAQVLNHVAFPVTPEQVRRDLENGSERPPTVLLAKPGDVAVIKNYTVTIAPGAAGWVQSAEFDSIHAIKFCPTAIGGAFQEALTRAPKDLPTAHRWQSILDSVAALAGHAAAKSLRAWKVVYQLVIEQDGALYPLWLNFAGKSTAWQLGWSELRNYTVFVSAELLNKLLLAQVSWSYVVTSGEYRTLDMVYRFYEGKISRPADHGETIVDPLFIVFRGRLDELLIGSLRAELAAAHVTEMA